MTITPLRSSEQRMDALQLANEVRARRAAVKRDLKAAEPGTAVSIARVFIGWPGPDERIDLSSMPVEDLLLALPKFGTVRVGRILLRAGVSHSKTLGGLTERQRGALRDELSKASGPSVSEGRETPQTRVMVGGGV